MEYMEARMQDRLEASMQTEQNAMEDGQRPAFPVADYDHSTFNPGHVDIARRLLSGMTLRDYFAVKAMNGYLANAWQAKELDDTGESSGEQMRIVAEISYAMADAMLVARAKS